MPSRSWLEVYEYFRAECMCGWSGETSNKRHLALRESKRHRETCEKLAALYQRAEGIIPTPPPKKEITATFNPGTDHIYPGRPCHASLYKNGCRCAGCKEANKVWCRAYRLRRRMEVPT